MNFGLGFGARLGFSFWDVVLTLELRLAIEISHSPRVGDPNVVSSPNRQSHPQGVQNLLCSTGCGGQRQWQWSQSKDEAETFHCISTTWASTRGAHPLPGPILPSR